MPDKTRKRPLTEDIPTGSREKVQAGDYAPEGLRGGLPPTEEPGPSPAAPDQRDVAAGSTPQAHPLHGSDAPDGSGTI